MGRRAYTAHVTARHPDLRGSTFALAACTHASAVTWVDAAHPQSSYLINSMYSTRSISTPVLKSTQRLRSARPRNALHAGKILVVTQVAVAVILLVSAGLLSAASSSAQ